jgi:hypothetical protein
MATCFTSCHLSCDPAVALLQFLSLERRHKKRMDLEVAFYLMKSMSFQIKEVILTQKPSADYNNQDPRGRFATRSLEGGAGKLMKLGYPIKDSVFLFLSGVLNSLPGKFPYVTKYDDETPNEDRGWASLIISLADGRTDDGSLETVMNSNLDNPLEVINGGFITIDHLPNPDDFQGEVVTIDRMKEIGHQVIARMLQDKMKCEERVEKAIPGFDLNSVTLEVVGPLLDSDFGLLFCIRVQDHLDLEFDPKKWY